ncbi:MAG: FAD:protein FMN transferase [Planctomycetes bacterium]|nr:FAD:protein FMN transferase [Planctomycetota bacterium]
MPPHVPLALSCLLLVACGGPPPVQRFGGPTMGSTYEVQYVASVPAATVRNLVEQELAEFDLAFSQWRDDSEIARVNAHASTTPLPVSPRFAAVLALALRVAEVTEGAFDPTVKPLSDLYRKAKRDPQNRLDSAAVTAALPQIGHHRIALRDGAVVKQAPEVQVDLDGLVAGAAADAIAERLHEIGVRSFFLQITGEVLAHGEKAPGVPWIAGVVDPAADGAGGEVAITSLPLRDRALCTSGDYRNGFVSGGAFVHHVFDPRTGRNPPHRVVSVSVLARTAAIADALGTALLVLGDEASKPLMVPLSTFGPIGVLFLVAEDDGGLRRVEVAWPQ